MPQIPQGGGSKPVIPITYKQFFDDVIRGVGGKPSPGAEQALTGLVLTEGANDYWNPWNIEWHQGNDQRYLGIGDQNSVGVQRYGSYAQGVKATIAFMEDNSGWHPVIKAIKSGSAGELNQALTNVYTWAHFKITTPSEAKQILADRMSGHHRSDPFPQTGGSGGGSGGGFNPGSTQGGQLASVSGILGDIESFGQDITGFTGDVGNFFGNIGNSIGDALRFIGAAFVFVAKFFEKLLWIFNVDHFMKFMLYVIGFLAIASGLAMVTMGAGKPEEVAV